ncbi:hypothetical protein ACFWCB_28980 [Streptomyces sp. NPDC060048]|uniref:hypothetical protein n=1 Tax=unclassified Streptomyces TaxID=2593676 RepID=UPI0036964100
MRGQQEQGNESAVEWLKLVLAVVTLAALTVIYFLLPPPERAGSGIEFIRACLPNVITALVVFPALYLVLGPIGQRNEDRLARVVQNSIGATEAGIKFPDDVSGTVDFIREVVAKEPSQRGAVDIEILAFTGGTFTTALLRDLVQQNPNKLNIVMRTIDFSLTDGSQFPAHWEREEAETVDRLKSLCEGKAGLEIWHYPAFPFLLGLSIGRSHLLVTFPSWDLRTGRLADKSLEYRYYGRNSRTEHLFELFENWSRQPGQVPVHPAPAPAPVPAPVPAPRT